MWQEAEVEGKFEYHRPICPFLYMLVIVCMYVCMYYLSLNVYILSFYELD